MFPSTMTILTLETYVFDSRVFIDLALEIFEYARLHHVIGFCVH